MTLGELISSKGYKQKFVLKKLNEDDVEMCESHFSKVCNNLHTPRPKRFYVSIGKILSESEQVIRNCFL